MFSITREIQIDAGHRIPEHHSKCRHIHGHRYVVKATLSGALQYSGSQEGMVLDFGYIKEIMMDMIHEPCDHNLILSVKDPLLKGFLTAPKLDMVQKLLVGGKKEPLPGVLMFGPEDVQLYIISAVPTAENLAALWFNILKPIFLKKYSQSIVLEAITVHETPNSIAVYTGENNVRCQ